MPEIRSVSVRLDADVASYIAKMKLAGAETDRAFSTSSHSIDTSNRSLGNAETALTKVDTQTRKVSTSTRQLGNDIDRTRLKVDTGAKSIDRYSGRLGVLLDVGLALAPALAPIGAELVPATFALGSNVTSLGIGAGVTMLAFHGLGDALTKFNKAALDPTATNIKNAQEAMDKLPPSAQRFVLQLHRMGPELEGLQRIAADGILPGARAGLRDLESDLPLVRRGIRLTSQEIGTLAHDTGDALSSRRWRPFIRFLGTETPQALDTLSRAGGHTLHGLATLLMGFGSTTREIDQGILNLARDFDHWATVTQRSKGFEDFLDYLRENGPRVLDLLGQTAVTFVDIGRAVAPLGGPTLDILTHLLEIVDGIANSDLGTPLFAGILAWRLYARVAQLSGVQVETSFRGVVAAPGQIQAGLRRATSSTQAWARGSIADIRAVAAEYRLLGRSALSVAGGPKHRGEAKGPGLTSGALLAGGTALLASGAADSLGVTNTATLALVGSLAGPPGAIAGGLVGAFIDARKASDDFTAGQKELDRVIASNASQFADYTHAVEVAQGARDKLFTDFSADGNTAGQVFSHPGEALGITFSSLKGDNPFEQSRDAANDALVAVDNLRTAYGQIAFELSGPLTDAQGRSIQMTDAQVAAIEDRATPAMLALGISVDDLRQAAERNDGSLEHLTGRISRWIERSDSASGRTQAVAAAFAQMGNEALTTDDRVQALSDSLDALLGPTLGLSAAQDQFTKDLRTLRGELAKGSKTLKGNSDAALQNREAIRNRVSDLSDLIKAEANAGASPEKLTRTLKTQRQALIDAGAQAGISRQQMKDYLDELGLTPKLVKTAIELSGTAEAENNLQNLTRDRVVHITVRTDHLGAQDTTATGGHVLTGHASGGTIPGPRYPYRDKLLVPVAPTEEIISNDRGQADMNRGALKAANRGARLAVIDGPGLAGGGTAGVLERVSTHITTRSSSSSVERIVERLPSRMRLAVDGDDLYAVIDNSAQANYNSNRRFEEAHR